MNGLSIGKWLVWAGLALVVLGGILWFAGKIGLPLGRLPGDLHWKGERGSFHFPIVTCIIGSILLTILVNLALRFWGK
ncbi:MAG TPA: DUF2905 domain-containing protein [Candidatus Hydrogenedentes bacterium]|nr:DUF2905 domain-containing protein [Candidatus Hydrogenedentota bacterium]